MSRPRPQWSTWYESQILWVNCLRATAINMFCCKDKGLVHLSPCPSSHEVAWNVHGDALCFHSAGAPLGFRSLPSELQGKREKRLVKTLCWMGIQPCYKECNSRGEKTLSVVHPCVSISILIRMVRFTIILYNQILLSANWAEPPCPNFEPRVAHLVALFVIVPHIRFILNID